MTRNAYVILAGAGSVALLAGAFFFQAIGYPPCTMCLWQRWPHAAAIAVMLLALVLPGRWLPLAGALAMAATVAIGLYHTGVERDWWEGPSSCTGAGAGLGGLSGTDLLALDGPVLVMCDEVSWQFLTLSMASWNMLLSLGLMAVWIAAYRASRP